MENKLHGCQFNRQEKPMILGFDTESARLIPSNRHLINTVGLTCAGFAWRMPDGVATATIPTIIDGETYKPELEREEANDILTILEGSERFYTWGGMNFDMQILATVSEQRERTIKLALGEKHWDLHLLFIATNGHFLSLGKAAENLGLKKGTADIKSGALAPQMWADGRYQEVLRYLTNDALMTLLVGEHLSELGHITWNTKGGRENVWTPSDSLSVLHWHPEALYDFEWEPSPSWTRTQINKDDFYDWINR